MIHLLRSESLKQRSTRTNAGLLAGMLGLVLLAVLLHGFGLGAEHIGTRSQQLTLVAGWGERLGAVFAALLGAMSVTAEIRHGTIRPTLIVTPRRSRIFAAKVMVSIVAGFGFGLAAAALAFGLGLVALSSRGIDLQLDAGDGVQFILGGTVAAALWAAIGVGLGAVVRSQVPALVGICVWLLFVEGLLVGDVAGVGAVGRFAPGAAAAAITGQDPARLLDPGGGLAVLVGYAGLAALAGALATSRRDVVA